MRRRTVHRRAQSNNALRTVGAFARTAPIRLPPPSPALRAGEGFQLETPHFLPSSAQRGKVPEGRKGALSHFRTRLSHFRTRLSLFNAGGSP